MVFGVLAGEGRIANENIETLSLFTEHFWELEIPVKWGDALVTCRQLLADLAHRILNAFILKGFTDQGQVDLLELGPILRCFGAKESGRHHVARFP